MEFDRERRKVLIASGSDKGIEYLTGQLSGGRYDTSYPSQAPPRHGEGSIRSRMTFLS